MNTTDSVTGTGTDLIGTVADWLMAQALGTAEVESLVEGCFTRLWAAGVPLWRAHVAYRTIHPLFAVIGLLWQRGDGMVSVGHRHGESEASEG